MRDSNAHFIAAHAKERLSSISISNAAWADRMRLQERILKRLAAGPLLPDCGRSARVQAQSFRQSLCLPDDSGLTIY
jgi:hypothetical protein